jgi:hypothetical protein
MYSFMWQEHMNFLNKFFSIIAQENITFNILFTGLWTMHRHIYREKPRGLFNAF